MHVSFLGDSYDLVKRFFLSTLSGLGPWSVHPMFMEVMEPADARQFELLIGAPLCTEKSVRTPAGRIESLARCKLADHLLLDPDTGVRMAAVPVAPSPRHVYASELVEIVDARPSFLTAVYDQSLLRGREPVQLKEKLERFREFGVSGFAYTSHASFLFLSKDENLLERATRALEGAGLPKSRLIQGA